MQTFGLLRTRYATSLDSAVFLPESGGIEYVSPARRSRTESWLTKASSGFPPSISLAFSFVSIFIVGLLSYGTGTKSPGMPWMQQGVARPEGFEPPTPSSGG